MSDTFGANDGGQKIFVQPAGGFGGPPEGSDLGVEAITRNMEVVTATGDVLGFVDSISDAGVRLVGVRGTDEQAVIPRDLVDYVDSRVHLKVP